MPSKHGVRKRSELDKLISDRERRAAERLLYLKMNEIIDELRDRKVISNIIAGKWHRLQGIRNKVFHAMVLAPTEREIRDSCSRGDRD